MTASANELQAFFDASTLLAKAGLLPQAQQLTFTDGCVQFGTVAVNSYFASVLADFIRHKLLAARVSFTLKLSCRRPTK